MKILEFIKNFSFAALILIIFLEGLKYLNIDVDISGEIYNLVVLITFFIFVISYLSEFFLNFENNLSKLNKNVIQFGESCNKSIKKFFNSKINKYFVIPVILLGFGVIISLFAIYSIDGSLGTIKHTYSKSIFINYQEKPLYEGDKLKAQFKAKDNNLGIIALRFNTNNDIVDDRLHFRIKKKGNNEWYYQKTYKTDQFKNEHFFTIGFPPIEDSLGDIFIFEVVSLDGQKGNAVKLSQKKNIVETTYKFEMQKLSKNKYNMIQHLLKKFLSKTKDLSFLIVVLFYFLPLWGYIFFLINLRKNNGFFDIYIGFKMLFTFYLLIEISIQLIRLVWHYFKLDYLTIEYFKVISFPLLILTFILGTITFLTSRHK